MTDWKAKYIESEVARAKVVEALENICARMEVPGTANDFYDKNNFVGGLVLSMREALSAQPPNDVAETLREAWGLIYHGSPWKAGDEFSEEQAERFNAALAKLHALMGER